MPPTAMFTEVAVLPLTFHLKSDAVNDAVLGAVVPLAKLGATATAAPNIAISGR